MRKNKRQGIFLQCYQQCFANQCRNAANWSTGQIQ
ncbi:hypothetical protein J4448_00100 [Candidatus Woesearchaeota archaeon]|nr:hypothetical protein [Candidatus Woesearchaeota archaeon]